MAGTAISDATTTTPVMADMIPFARTADATARHMTGTALETLLFDRAIVINTTGADVDFNVKASGVANALFVRGSDGFVGIGTATPLVLFSTYHATLNKVGRFQSGDDLATIEVHDDDTTSYFGAQDGYTFLGGEASLVAGNFVVNNTTGFVGIGTATPAVPLDVAGAIKATSLVTTGGTSVFNEGGDDVNFRVEAVGVTNALWVKGSNGSVGMGKFPTVNMPGLVIEAGLLTLKERALPTADTDYGKIWTESDNTLHFQDGAGTEYTVDITPV